MRGKIVLRYYISAGQSNFYGDTSPRTAHVSTPGTETPTNPPLHPYPHTRQQQQQVPAKCRQSVGRRLHATRLSIQLAYGYRQSWWFLVTPRIDPGRFRGLSGSLQSAGRRRILVSPTPLFISAL